MPFIEAVSIAPAACDWLANSSYPRILHVFDHACNLINEHREVLSAVTRHIGNGPFNLVVGNDVVFCDHLHAQSRVSIAAGQIRLGDLIILRDSVHLWQPRPDWDGLRGNKDRVLSQLIQLRLADHKPLLPESLISSLCSSIAGADNVSARTAASRLAGLGNGLTPAGDDFLLGAVYAARVLHPPGVAHALAAEVTTAAAPLTTSLSAAWLRAAGRGEAGMLWHRFFAALLAADGRAVQTSGEELLAVGHSSGADALAGFIGTLAAVPAIP